VRVYSNELLINSYNSYESLINSSLYYVILYICVRPYRIVIRHDFFYLHEYIMVVVSFFAIFFFCSLLIIIIITYCMYFYRIGVAKRAF